MLISFLVLLLKYVNAELECHENANNLFQVSGCTCTSLLVPFLLTSTGFHSCHAMLIIILSALLPLCPFLQATAPALLVEKKTDIFQVSKFHFQYFTSNAEDLSIEMLGFFIKAGSTSEYPSWIVKLTSKAAFNSKICYFNLALANKIPRYSK